jgi:hypothetical protein
MRTLTSALVVGMWACGGKPAQAPVPPVQPGPSTSRHAPAVTPGAPAPKAVADTHEPEYFAPLQTKVAVHQTISFGTSVIDQDLDETRVDVTKMPKTATFDPITQTVTWTVAADDVAPQFELQISQPERGKTIKRELSFEIIKGKTVVPPMIAPLQARVIETLLMIRSPGRLVQVNKDWPLDKLLAAGAQTFRLQLPEDRRKTLGPPLDGATAYRQLLAGLAKTQNNRRLDPNAPEFDISAFGDPKSWKIVAVRPRIDKAWTELRVVYQAMNAKEPVFAMFRLRPVVEYVPALPRPDEERDANNKLFLGMVAKHLMKDGGPNPKFVKDEAAEGRAVSALVTELMTFDDTKTKPYLHGFAIEVQLEARMGGGSARNPDASYKSGDGWGWAVMKPLPTTDGTAQAYVDVPITGFWTATAPSKDRTTWMPVCAPRFNPADPAHAPGYEGLCRQTMGLVDLPAMKDGKVTSGTVDANNLYFEYKKHWATERIVLEDGRRDLGEENGMTCSQCHIRNFGMHDAGDLANVDPSKGTPKAPNHAIGTLDFQIIPGTRWEDFTLEFLQHQECRGKAMFEQVVGPDAAKGLTCPLAK